MSLLSKRLWRSCSTLEGPAARVEMRVFGAQKGIDENRLDVLKFFIEECKVPVNTLTEVLKSSLELKKHISWTPLAYALYHCPGNKKAVTYLLDRLDKKEVTHTYEKEELDNWIETCAKKGNPLRSPVTDALMAPWYVRSQAMRSMAMEHIEKKIQEWKETG